MCGWFVGAHPQIIKPSLLSTNCQYSLIQLSSSGLECDIPEWPRLQQDVAAFSQPIALTVRSCVPKCVVEDVWMTKFSQWAWKPDFFPWFVIANWKGVHSWLWLGYKGNSTIFLQTFVFIPVLVLLLFLLLLFNTTHLEMYLRLGYWNDAVPISRGTVLGSIQKVNTGFYIDRYKCPSISKYQRNKLKLKVYFHLSNGDKQIRSKII